MFNLMDIKDPSFLKQLNISSLNSLASDIREFLVSSISKTGGHLASNLGVVELTIGLHYVFDSPKDKILFDVGHQSYVHKILTGRAQDFKNLRNTNGLSGFISSFESVHDIWESGHSSTTISALSGILEANKKNGDDSFVVALIGDASISSGVAFEGLNYIGSTNQKAIIVLNDNKMGIDNSVGALVDGMNNGKIKDFANSLGFDYVGPINGHNISEIIETLENAKKNGKKVIIHALTHKGEGYSPALENPLTYHGLDSFDPITGEIIGNTDGKKSFSEIVASEFVNLRENKEFSIINPAMLTGSELKTFKEKYPEDCYDVGISESHAALMAAGMALEGKKVVLSLYSTFAQRAFDEILNDISRQNLNVFITLDRAGVVGKDGSTHQGIYDLAMLRMMPHMVIAAGKDASEVRGLVDFAINYDNGPIALRFPRLKVNDREKVEIKDFSWQVLKEGKKGIIISYGPDIDRIMKLDLDATIINARFLRPLDKKMLDYLAELNKPILVYEQVSEASSLSEGILAYYHKKNMNHICLHQMNFNNNVVIEHGNIDDILEKYHLSDKYIIEEFNKLICD